MKFISKFSGLTFYVKNQRKPRQFVDGKFETKDKEVIETLKNMNEFGQSIFEEKETPKEEKKTPKEEKKDKKNK